MISTKESVGLIQPMSMVNPSRGLGHCRSSLTMNPSESIRRSCHRCPSCTHIRNICEYSQEETPLLASNIRDARYFDKSLIAIFIFILLFGSAIGIYLLFIETEGAIIEEFDYISRETWGVNNTFLKDIPPLHRPVSKILLLELIPNCTDTTNHCLEYEEFIDNNKEKLRIFNGQVLYNFYQDQFGTIFEGRGWTFQSDCGQQSGCADILAIGILEEHSVAPPSRQIKKLKAFLDFGIMGNFLNPCYEIMVSHRQARYFDDLAYTLTEMNKRDRSCKYYY